MSVVLVATTAKFTADGNGFDTVAIDTTGADLIVVVRAFVAVNTLSDSKSNTWTDRTQRNTTSGSVIISYCSAPIVGSGHVFSSNGPAKNGSTVVFAFSGSSATPYDVENGANATSVSSLATGSVTPSTDGQILIAATVLVATGVTATVDSGFTTVSGNSADGSTHVGLQAAYLIENTATAKNPTFTASGSSNMATTIATFKATGLASAGLLVMF